MKNTLFFKIIKKYRFQSLFFKLFFNIFITLAILLSFLVVMYVSIYVSKANTQIHNAQAAAVHSITTELDNLLDSALSASHMICSNSTILDYLNKSSPTPNELADHASVFTEITNYIMPNSNFLDSIYLYKSSNGYLLSKKLSGYDYLFPDMNWYEQYCKNGERNAIIFRQTSIFKSDISYLSVIYNIYSGSKISGILIFNFRTQDILTLAESHQCTNFTFCLGDGSVVFSSDTPHAGTALPIPEEIQTSYVQDDNFFVLEKLSKNEGFISCTFPEYKIIQSAHTFIWMIVFFVLAVAAASSVISYILSYRFYKSILMIINIFNHDTDNTASANEIQYISNHILDIKSNLKNYEEELAKNIMLLKKAKISSMQSQINPHFIFNTLNLISSMDMAENKGDTKLSNTVRLLSDILREAINSNENITSFEKELKYLEKYIALQNIKYNNMFRYTRQIDMRTLSLSCAKFILQPIVENAIKHGIQHSITRDYEISVLTQLCDDDFIIKVHNNGVGIPQTRLDELRTSLQRDDIPSEHIGLLNINSRIKLLFGERYGLSIFSDENGVSVIIKLPIIPYTSL